MVSFKKKIMKVITNKMITKKQIEELHDNRKCMDCDKLTGGCRECEFMQPFIKERIVNTAKQSQSIFYVIQSVVIILAIAEIIWFTITKL